VTEGLANYRRQPEEVPFDLEAKVGLRLAETTSALARFIENPIEKDQRIHAFRRDQYERLVSGEQITTSIYRSYYEAKFRQRGIAAESIPPIYPSNLMLRLLQKNLSHEQNWPPGLGYPDDFDTPEKWRAGVDHLLSDDERRLNLQMEILFLEIQSNVADRYKSLKLGLSLFGDNFTDRQAPRVMDVGCSLNLGGQIIANNLPFFSESDPYLSRRKRLLPEGREIKALRRLLKEAAPLGEVWGVDIFSPTDSNMRDWVFACSLYPSELMDAERVAHFNRIAEAASPKVHFVYNDFADPFVLTGSERFSTVLPEPGSMDVICLFTVLYEVPPAKRQLLINRALESLTPRGILLVQDFALVDAGSPQELDFDPWYHPNRADRWPYKTFVWEKTAPESGFQTLFEWSSGRCMELKLSALALRKIRALG